MNGEINRPKESPSVTLDKDFSTCTLSTRWYMLSVSVMALDKAFDEVTHHNNKVPWRPFNWEGEALCHLGLPCVTYGWSANTSAQCGLCVGECWLQRTRQTAYAEHPPINPRKMPPQHSRPCDPSCARPFETRFWIVEGSFTFSPESDPRYRIPWEDVHYDKEPSKL